MIIDANEKDILVFFSGRGAWFINESPTDKFGAPTALNFLYRDPFTNIVELTNEFGRLYDGIDQKYCNEHTGVFKLTAKDSAIYLFSKDRKYLSHVEKLLPCSHAYSAFSIAVEQRILSNEMTDDCFFMIQKDIDFECFEHSKITELAYTINNELRPVEESILPDNREETDVNTATNQTLAIIDLSEITAENSRPKKLGDTNVARLESLRKFIEWLGTETKNNNFDFDPQCLDYTKDALFKALQDWEKTRGKTKVNEKPKWLWYGVIGWRSCGGFWNSKERKGICDIKDNNRGRKPGSQNIYKKNFS
ncbi:MAG: hypothetical protein ACNA7G_13945 [Methylobacter sp.]